MKVAATAGVIGAGPIVDPTAFRLSRFNDGTPLFLDPGSRAGRRVGASAVFLP